MNFLSRISSKLTKPPIQEGLNSIKNTVKKISGRVTDILDNVFRPYQDDRIEGGTFDQGLPVKSIITGAMITVGGSVYANHTNNLIVNADRQSHSQTENFKLFFPEKPLGTFVEISPKQVPLKEVEKSIDPSKMKRTDYSLKGSELRILRETKNYTSTGEFADTLSKGTKIIPDTSKHVITKGEASYTPIVGHNGTPNGEFVIEPGYIRTPNLDDKVNTKGIVPTKEKKDLFSGYIGPNGKEIPAYIMKAVTVNYFGKVMAPKIHASITRVDAKIATNRRHIQSEVLGRKISIDKLPIYKIQKQDIAKKGSLTQVYSAIQSFSANGGNVMSSDITTIIGSIQKTPEWQNILNQAASVSSKKQKIKARSSVNKLMTDIYNAPVHLKNPNHF